MLADANDNIKQFALRTILEERKKDQTSDTVRVFKIPVMNFNATQYTELINWETENIFEPPFTKKFSIDELKSFFNKLGPIEISKFPCHTQATERCIKLVTGASSAVLGVDNRNGYLHAKISSQKAMPTQKKNIRTSRSTSIVLRKRTFTFLYFYFNYIFTKNSVFATTTYFHG